MVVILFNSSVPGTPLPTSGLVSTLLAKLGHVTEYGLLGWLAWRALAEAGGGVGLGPRAAAALVVLGGGTFAALDELRQLFVAGRGASPWDVLLDGMSLLVVAGLLARPAADGREQALQPVRDDLPGEGGDEQVHRQDLAVAVGVRQEDHHDGDVQGDEAVEQQGGGGQAADRG